MLGALGQVMSSEYSNAGDLLGIDGDMNTELLGYLSSLDAVSRAKVMSKLVKRQIPSQGSRAEMEKFFGELPVHIKDGLLSGKLRLADTVIYTIKPVNGAKTVKMFETQDVKEVGIRNISNGRLPKNTALLVSGIVMLTGVSASLGLDDQKSTVFSSIDTNGAISTGEFSIKANKKQIVSSTSNVIFKTDNFQMVPKGYYKLNNPRLIQDDVDIEFEIELGTVTGVAANQLIYIGLVGTATIP